MIYSVIGTGAIGGYYGSKLAKAGLEVHFLLHNDYQHVKQNGLYIKSCDGDFKIKNVNAYNTTTEMPKSDVVIVALKTTNQDLLKTLLPPLLKDDTIVLLIQNGIGVEEDLSKVFPTANLAAGLAFICSAKIEQGFIYHQCYGHINIGNYNCKNTEKFQQLINEFNAANIKTSEVEYYEARWKKAVWNMPFNGMCVVLNTTTDKLVNNPETKEFVVAQMHEVINVAQASGVESIDYSFADQMIKMTKEMIPYSPSMRLDYLFRRKMEIKYLYDKPFEVADKYNCPMIKLEILARKLRIFDNYGIK